MAHKADVGLVQGLRGQVAQGKRMIAAGREGDQAAEQRRNGRLPVGIISPPGCPTVCSQGQAVASARGHGDNVAHRGRRYVEAISPDDDRAIGLQNEAVVLASGDGDNIA